MTITRWWERVLLAVPAVAAVGLASLYTVGALIKSAELEGAGLSIRDTLPLFSLETILGAGIGTVIRSALLLLIILSGAAVTFSAARAIGMATRRRLAEQERHVRREKKGAIPAEKGKRPVPPSWVRPLGITLMIVMTAVVSLLFPPAFTPFIAVALSVPIIGVWKRIPTTHPLVSYVAAGQYLLLVCAFVVSAFAYPSPLPSAAVQIQGRVKQGGLVAITDSAWYLAIDGRVEAIPIRHVERGSFVSRERSQPASTGTELLRLLNP